MKTFFAALVFIAILSARVFAVGPFEGTVTMLTTKSGETSTLIFSIKGDRTRVDMPAAGPRPATTVMMNGATNKSTIVMDQMKMYMEHDMTPKAERKPGTLPPPTNTGQTETILGHVCEIWESATPDSGLNRLWLATDLTGYFAMAGGPMSGSNETPGARFIREQHKFPLRIVELNGGTESSRIEVTALEAKTIDVAIFEVPAGYHKMEMGMH